MAVGEAWRARLTVRHKASKVAADDAVPGRALSLVKLRVGGQQGLNAPTRDGGDEVPLTVRLMCCAMSWRWNISIAVPALKEVGGAAHLFNGEFGHGILGCAHAASSVSLDSVGVCHRRTNFDGLLLHVVRLGRRQSSGTESGFWGDALTMSADLICALGPLSAPFLTVPLRYPGRLSPCLVCSWTLTAWDPQTRRRERRNIPSSFSRGAGVSPLCSVILNRTRRTATARWNQPANLPNQRIVG